MNATENLHARRASEAPILVRLREESKRSQDEVARTIGVTVRRLRRMEQGRSPVGAEHTDALADLYGVDAHDLFEALRTAYRDRGDDT